MAQMKRRPKKISPRAAKGEAQRRRVLGNDYVNASLAGVDDFNRELMTFIHEWVWNDVWTRPQLPLKTRSLINLALLTAINRPKELLIHLRGALNNGCSVAEIKEVLLHTALYAGIPATIDGFHLVRDALREWGHLPPAKKPKTKPKPRQGKAR
jgi:4-carboxymuconolactone decarboxylase